MKSTPYPVAPLIPIFAALICGSSSLAALAPLLLPMPLPAKLAWLAAAPLVFSATFVIACAMLSLPFQRSIHRGKFPRVLTHVVYGPRRLYGLCWGAVFYSPAYYFFTSIPPARKALFWLFGYRGHPEVHIAPDAWIRDLPLLQLSEGTYVANKATLGTNICLADGTVLVDRIRTGKGAMIGHLAMIAPGCTIGAGAEIGVGCAIGIRVRIGENTRVSPTCSINHGARIGNSVVVGAKSYVGLGATIGDGIRLPSGSCIPDGAVVHSQEDVASYLGRGTALIETNGEPLLGVGPALAGAEDAWSGQAREA